MKETLALTISALLAIMILLPLCDSSFNYRGCKKYDTITVAGESDCPPMEGTRCKECKWEKNECSYVKQTDDKGAVGESGVCGVIYVKCSSCRGECEKISDESKCVCTTDFVCKFVNKQKSRG